MGRIIIIIILAIMLKSNITAKKEILTPMEALDLVKETYATNFTKTSLQDNPEDYFYKLDQANYYLVYEEANESNGYYLIRLYEFVLDDPDTGLGHTVTYGYYWVDPYTGEIEVYE